MACRVSSFLASWVVGCERECGKAHLLLGTAVTAVHSILYNSSVGRSRAYVFYCFVFLHDKAASFFGLNSVGGGGLQNCFEYFGKRGESCFTCQLLVGV